MTGLPLGFVPLAAACFGWLVASESTTTASVKAAAWANDNPWAQASSPAPGDARSIGGYSNGCIRGAVELPRVGSGYQVARPSRGRHYGHPELVSFVQSFAKSLHDDGHGVVFVGDLGQPRGGPAPSGHKSHQTGLDADLWFWAPASAAKTPWSAARTETLSPRSIVAGKTKTPTKHFDARVTIMLQRASEDTRVDRIFVNPGIKRELCMATPQTERGWLRKLRPWWGHDSHFHVRLHCPASSPDCKAQGALPAGDGCDAVAWWFDEKAQAERAKNRRQYRKDMGKTEGLPAACEAVVDG